MATPPVFLPGESHGQRILAGYSPRGHKELNTTEATQYALRKMDPVSRGLMFIFSSSLTIKAKVYKNT